MFILDSENWVACLPRDHRLAHRSELQIAELLDEPIVVHLPPRDLAGLLDGDGRAGRHPAEDRRRRSHL